MSFSDIPRLPDIIHALTLRFVEGPHDHFGQETKQNTNHRNQECHYHQQRQRRHDEGNIPVDFEIKHPQECDSADYQAEYAAAAKEIHGFAGNPVEELYHQQVEQNFEHALETVFRFPGTPRMMVDHQLSDFCPMPRRIDGQETVHLPVQADPVDYLSFVGFERAAKIMQAHSGHRRNQPVGENTRNVPLNDIVLPIFPPTRNHIETLINEVQHSRDIGGIVLSIAIQRDDHVALSEIEARHHRSGLTGVSLEVNDANSPIRIGQLVQNCG